jgi:hypothetical protein
MHANCFRDNCRAVIDKWEAKQICLEGGFLEVRRVLEPLKNNQVLFILRFHIEPPHNSQKWIYKIKLLQIVKVIVSNCCFILSQIRLFDLIVRVNIFDKLFSLI